MVRGIAIQSLIVQNPEFRNQKADLRNGRKENDLAAMTGRTTMYEQTMFRRGQKPVHEDGISARPRIDRNSCIIGFLEVAESFRNVG